MKIYILKSDLGGLYLQIIEEFLLQLEGKISGLVQKDNSISIDVKKKFVNEVLDLIQYLDPEKCIFNILT